MRHMVPRLIRLWFAFFRNCVTRDMEFKLNFLGDLFMDAIFYGSYFFLFSVIFSHVDQLGQFSKDAVIIFLVITYLTDTIFIFFFGNNTFQVNRMVVRGDLDFLLIKPVNSLFFISFRYVACYGIISGCEHCSVLGDATISINLCAYTQGVNGAQVVFGNFKY